MQTYREHPEILIEAPEQIVILAKGAAGPSHPGRAAAVGAATRPSSQDKPRLFGAYSRLTLTDEQRAKVAAIQKEGNDAERAFEQKLREEEDAKMAPLLSDEQKEQLKKLKEEPAGRSRNRPAQPAERD